MKSATPSRMPPTKRVPPNPNPNLIKTIMNTEHLKGSRNILKGKVKQGVGEAVDDEQDED